jgi:alpha-amylase/alpha-mannosidase (GH57 family)
MTTSQTRQFLRRVAQRCYLPANEIMLALIKQHKGAFKISYSISGVVLDQFEKYAPEVIESFRELAKTGCVEFLAETYAHSLSSLVSEEEFAFIRLSCTLQGLRSSLDRNQKCSETQSSYIQTRLDLL